ncbi:hypothetical protein ABFS83_08G084600 [Erythranthe nasuta]
MGSSAAAAAVFIFFWAALFPIPTLSGPISEHSITPEFTASHFHFIDNSGAFLSSPNNSFQARIANPKPESGSFYFVVVHVSSNTIIWSANRNRPISQSSQLRFTAAGLTLYNDTGHPIWSTPEKLPSVSSMRLLESGNLVLLDIANNTVWGSFDSPTDVLVAGQKLPAGKSLVSSVGDDDLSEGSYRLVVGGNDAVLQWNLMNYWKLSMDKRAFRDTNSRVDYMVMNFTGLYLIGESVVIKITFPDSLNSSNFKIVKLDRNGALSVMSFNPNDGSNKQDFTGPPDRCEIPYICRRLGVCTNGGYCQCAPAFRSDPKTNIGDCAPADNSLSLPARCNDSSSSSSSSDAVKYLNLRNDLDYFSNDFTDPIMHDATLSTCQNLCSKNCSCLGVFHSHSFGSCHMIMNYFGSVLIKSSLNDRLGYVKAIAVENNIPNAYLDNNKSSDFPILASVLLPSSGVVIIILVATFILFRRRKKRLQKYANSKLGRGNSSSSTDEDIDYFVLIPGLPVRFNYQELVEATGSFGTQIGSGGFGTVFKGTLKDGTDVAVKKITCLGAHGKREFLTEIAVIGKIHHVNLVRLKGFCAHRGQKLLVYEYMRRGSLDRTLFHGDPVLEWGERYEIALGAAKGLAYLHTGCEHKVIHCDVKPENILLHDKSQVKISDFGLSKLLTPEQSGLFTTMRGTRGYLAPEWLTSSSISDKTDVYSYGMVLLEIIRGKKNSSPQSRNSNNNNSGSDSNGGNGPLSLPSTGESGLVYYPLFALEMHEERRYLELVDPRLMGRVESDEVEKLVRVALCCVQEEPNLRPSMTSVVGMLEGAVPLGEPRVESLNFLRFYGRRFTEESRLEQENSEQNEFMMMYRQPMTNTTSSCDSYSYMSSQQVSGPR